MKEASVIEPIRKVFDDEIAARITIFLRLITTRYFEWIEDHPLDGISVLQANDDELRLFKSMIEKGGDWKRTYVLPEDRLYSVKAINCLYIAKEFKAKNVIEYIEKELI